MRSKMLLEMSQDKNGWRPVVTSDPETGKQLNDRCMISNGKEAKLVKSDRINLTLSTPIDLDLKEIQKKVGASKLTVGKTSGKNKGTLTVRSKKFDIAF